MIRLVCMYCDELIRYDGDGSDDDYAKAVDSHELPCAKCAREHLDPDELGEDLDE